MPGELHERPWRDSAHNRNEALDLAQPHGEYVLIIDADDVLEIEPGFKIPALQADWYMLRIVNGPFSYSGVGIVRAALPWRWRGVLHEFLTCDDARTFGLLEGLLRRRGHDGTPETYRRDAEVLRGALQTESDPLVQSRYQFYLAQSYRDCGETESALQAYLKRTELGFSLEEVYVSFYEAAKLQEAFGRPFDEVMATYLGAANAVPSRAEAQHGASRYCRSQGRHKEGYAIAKRASLSGEAPDGLFVESWIYEYGLLDEFAVNAYWAGAYQDSLDACERILRERKCPEAERPRIEANATFARQQLDTGNVAVSAATDVYATDLSASLINRIKTLPTNPALVERAERKSARLSLKSRIKDVARVIGDPLKSNFSSKPSWSAVTSSDRKGLGHRRRKRRRSGGLLQRAIGERLRRLVSGRVRVARYAGHLDRSAALVPQAGNPRPKPLWARSARRRDWRSDVGPDYRWRLRLTMARRKHIDVLINASVWALYLAPERPRATHKDLAPALLASPYPAVRAVVSRIGAKRLRNALAGGWARVRGPDVIELANAHAWAEAAGLPLRPFEELTDLVAVREQLRLLRVSQEDLHTAVEWLVLRRWSRNLSPDALSTIKQFQKLTPEAQQILDLLLP